MTQANRPAQPLAIGSLNTLVIRFPGIYIDYQIDLDNPDNKDDTITLKQVEGGDYEHTIEMVNLSEFDHDWVLLEFIGAPQSGKYSLLHDPVIDGIDPFIIYDEVPYECFVQHQVVHEEVVTTAPASAEGEETSGDNDAMTIEEKRELLKNMETSYTSTQVATEQEVMQKYVQAQNDTMTIEEKRELLKNMETSYSSTQVATEAEGLAQAKNLAEDTTSGLAADVLPDNVSAGDVAATAAMAASAYVATENGVDPSIVNAAAVVAAEALAKKNKD